MLQDVIKGNMQQHSISSLLACSLCENQFLLSPSSFSFFPYFSLVQIEDANFSLNHPNQYFVESQKILGGGKDVKREVDTQQRSQENAAARAAREAAANASQALVEMTAELDSFFQDGRF